VQDPKSAKFDGMPISSIATGLVDYIAEPEQIPAKLIEYFERPLRQAAVSGVTESNLKKIVTIIRRQSGHDFSSYKKSTILRRIERRIKMLQLSNIGQYAKLLQDNPREAELLFKDMLIRVTSFFREPDAFRILEKKVLPQLLVGKSYDIPVRVWICGCCSGEEAYSIAMLLAEHIEAKKITTRVQIFATDIYPEAIVAARRGIYPDTISANVSTKRLKKWFIHEGTSYQVKKELREMVIFAEQNVVHDSPFSKMDMVCCRNLLIYLEPQLQEKLLHTFYYSLNGGGFLFLGSSESLGKSAELFSTISRQWRIFQRKGLFTAGKYGAG
jgi:two-component system, chemotaxis family, CheB/CheR fusion protein